MGRDNRDSQKHIGIFGSLGLLIGAIIVIFMAVEAGVKRIAPSFPFQRTVAFLTTWLIFYWLVRLSDAS